jgi:hypothetical protein
LAGAAGAFGPSSLAERICSQDSRFVEDQFSIFISAINVGVFSRLKPTMADIIFVSPSFL